MEIQPGLRKRPYLEDRDNFMKVWSVLSGLMLAPSLLWMFGSYGKLGWWIFLTAAALVTCRVCAFFMWFVFKGIYAIDEPEVDKRRKLPGSNSGPNGDSY